MYNKYGLRSIKSTKRAPLEEGSEMADRTRLELAASGLTGQRSNQLNYRSNYILNGRCRIRTYDHLLVRQALYTS